MGGHLTRTNLSNNEKFPMLLPKCRVSKLIIRHTHACALHGGLQLTLRTLRQFWILRARNLVKNCIFKCMTCARQRAAMSYQQMRDLPETRVNTARLFTHTGIDYADPFLIRTSKGQGRKTHKAYCVLFICLATCAIHLEVAND